MNEKEYHQALRDFETLLKQIEGYELKHFPVEFPSPIAAIKFRMQEQGLRQKDLVPLFGHRSHVSEVLSGKRRLTLKMIRALHVGLNIPLDVLIQINH